MKTTIKKKCHLPHVKRNRVKSSITQDSSADYPYYIFITRPLKNEVPPSPDG